CAHSSASRAAPPRALPSFPTRRSSDLPTSCTACCVGCVPSMKYSSRLLPPLANCPVLRSIFTVTIPGGGVSGCSGTPSRTAFIRSEEHTSELQSRFDLVCRLLLEKKKN